MKAFFSFIKNKINSHLVSYMLNQCHYAPLYDVFTDVANEGYKTLFFGTLNASKLKYDMLPAEH